MKKQSTFFSYFPRNSLFCFFFTASLFCFSSTFAATSIEDKDQNQKEIETPVLLGAKTITYNRLQKQYKAFGKVQAYFGGRELTAEEVIYNVVKKRIHANDNIIIKTEDGSIQHANTVELTEDLSQGIASQFYLETPPKSFMGASFAIRQNEKSGKLIHAFYTVCTPNPDSTKPPFWVLKADKVIQNPENKMIYYKNAWMEVLGVPIFYTPFFAHADPTSKRHTGLLPPKIGYSKRTGFLYEQPYYISLSPYQDLTLTTRLTSKINPLFLGAYRKRFYSGQLMVKAGLSYEKEFDSQGEKFGQDKIRGHLFSEGLFQISPLWKWGYGLAQLSDNNYLLRYNLREPYFENLPFLTEDKQLLNQLFLSYNSDYSFFRIASLHYNSLLNHISDRTLPILAPMIDFEHNFKDPVFSGNLSIKGNLTVLNRLEGADYFRASTALLWEKDYNTHSGIILTPAAETRADLYRIGDQDHIRNIGKLYTRGLGYLSLKARWPFYRAGKQVDLLLEPIAQILVGTGQTDLKEIKPREYRLQHILNETSLGLDLDETNLFRHNRYSGYDRIDVTPRFVAGIKTQAYLGKRTNFAFFLGQSYALKKPIGYLSSSGLEERVSDYVGTVNFTLSPKLYLNSRFRWNHKNLTLNRLEANLYYSGKKFNLAANYLKFSERFSNIGKQEELSGSAGLQLFKNWSANYTLFYDIDSHIFRKQEAKLVFSNDCARLEFVYSHDETGVFILDRNHRLRNVGGSDSFSIRFSLATLGSYASN